MKERWTATWIKANAKIPGAVLMTFHMLPFAPTTAKKTCSTHVPGPQITRLEEDQIAIKKIQNVSSQYVCS